MQTSTYVKLKYYYFLNAGNNELKTANIVMEICLHDYERYVQKVWTSTSLKLNGSEHGAPTYVNKKSHASLLAQTVLRIYFQRRHIVTSLVPCFPMLLVQEHLYKSLTLCSHLLCVT